MAKIMTVEDSGLVRSIIKKILIEGGYEIVEASSGQDAIELYRLEKPDLVFMDINLPDVSGIDVTKELLTIDSDAKIIMCTIVESEKYRKEAIEAGAKDYLVKPFSKKEIIDVVNKYL